MVEVVIGAILIVIVLLIVGLIFRKKVYDNVDRLEAWKLDIMNRNVTEELAKVKKLNLSGETQEKFESWKDKWDTIVTKDLPDMEEYLLDAEEAADKFRIRSAQDNLGQVERQLQEIETKIEEMFEELDHLLNSEKYVRKQLEEIEPELKELKRELLHNRSQYSRAEAIFNDSLADMTDKLSRATELTSEGNYIEAQDLMEHLKTDLDLLKTKINNFPDLFQAVKKDFPAQIKDLSRQIEEMEEEGCRVKPFGFTEELSDFEDQLRQMVKQLNSGETEGIKDTLDQMDERIQEISQLLDQEANAKTRIENQLPKEKQRLSEIKERITEAGNQIKKLQESYYIESTILNLMSSLEKWLAKAEKACEQLEKNLENEEINHIEIEEKLTLFAEDLEKLDQAQDDFQMQIKDLRKDEIEAKEAIHHLKQQLVQTSKKLDKSNVPGIPSFIINAAEEATEKSDLVLKQLENHPLDMNQVQQLVEEAKRSVNYFMEQTNLLMDQARLVELTIQYGNRYRRQYPALSQALTQAETLFREYKYDAALEMSIKALEEVDPNVMQKIEELDKDIHHMAN
ncbi:MULTISPECIES: septation ring formation regulator EzrA [Gracilibacillus]|uniref:septation ring formation regulator EzrA n=1 Tax=Gracilibacillus TaxID=74385 RepID=UPI000825B0AB|nr:MULTISPECIES: septation ring formation regulator EzrA [Gracilibacillus]